MTIEKRLYQLIMNDRSMQVEIFSTPDTSKRIAIIVGMGEQNGLPVDPEIVRQILEHPPASEMSDAELENVVGGKGDPNQKIVGDYWAPWGKPHDDLDGRDGNDTIYGGEGSDTIHGGTGNDQLHGDGVTDSRFDGGDNIYGGDGNDSIWGNDGNDTLDGGTVGGAAKTTLMAARATTPWTVVRATIPWKVVREGTP